MDAAALVAEIRRLGVRLEVVGGRLKYAPASRLSPDQRHRLTLFRQQVARVLERQSPQDCPGGFLTSAEEEQVCRIVDLIERLADEARTTRLRCGSGWPGVAEKDRAALRAREYLRTRRTGSMDAPK